MTLCDRVSEGLVDAFFGGPTAERGRAHARDGRVIDLEDMDGEGHAFGAEVAELGSAPCEVVVGIMHLKRNIVDIQSSCTCRAELCEHGAAVLFAVLDACAAEDNYPEDAE